MRDYPLDGVPLPERTHVAELTVEDRALTAVSYHAPNGSKWGCLIKAEQAVACATWLATRDGPVVLGADANTPEVDAINFDDSITHCHTGNPRLHGNPGDDLMFGPPKIHGLNDALRPWLKDHPDELEHIGARRPNGPLAVSHRTGVRNARPSGTDWRFDAVWVSPHFRVDNVLYPYDLSVAAGSDHAAVIADLRWAAKRR